MWYDGPVRFKTLAPAKVNLVLRVGPCRPGTEHVTGPGRADTATSTPSARSSGTMSETRSW